MKIKCINVLPPYAQPLVKNGVSWVGNVWDEDGTPCNPT